MLTQERVGGMASEQRPEKATVLSSPETYSGGEADVEDESNAPSRHVQKEGGVSSSSLVQKLKGRIFSGGTGDDADGAKLDPQSGDGTPGRPGALPISSSPKPIDKGSPVSDELGTGYEEDTEPGSLSSEPETVPQSSNKGSSTHSGSLFKPVESKDDSELSLEDLRTSKTSIEDVKAPGLLGRAYEELEAVTEDVLESLHVKSRGGP